MALKDPKRRIGQSWLEETYALSQEVSCTLMLHPNLVNYIGGVDMRNPQVSQSWISQIQNEMDKKVDLI